ncbi:MAG: glutathione S-transferase [Rhodoferax sp.]|uniref:glutathione S-transferase n=1 Tax=Rhodoferax sp. TaxID=50421 RepID=UPI00271CA4FA|nr:glutathione S-transferase [Rhodoferax sp.]MDO8448339.1 glutathione S-transferase [Rhodoferax sp.]
MTPAPYPVLYSFRRCPYAMRARLALLASGQVCELREVVLARKPAALLEASAKGTVPVLVLPDGQVVDQSLDIMLWALRRNDPLHWLPANSDALMDARQLVARCDGEFKFHLDRYKYPNRHGVAEAAAHRTQGAVYLGDLNTRLTAHRHLLGEPESLADVAIVPFVRQFAHTDPAWFASQPWSALASWLGTFENSPIYQQVMTKYGPWEPGQPPVLFPEPPVAMI